MQLDFCSHNDNANIHDFDCGVKELNYFLHDLAGLYQKRHFGATLLFYEKGDLNKKVIGYYTISPAHVDRQLLPPKFMSGPQPNPLPAFRLCRLAIDRQWQGKRLGEAILIHALHKCSEEAKNVGGCAIIVDAKNEKVRQFYEKYGFQSLINQPLSLVVSIKFIDKHFNRLIT